jgi:EAL domain-containing protein (putative c-di-GMP-specific phosphodiesterase class I)
LVATLVQLGRDLGLKTLAEGVETMAQMDLFRVEHVKEVQGFLFEAQLLAPTRSLGAKSGQVLR